jgi:hypothetical protein
VVYWKSRIPHKKSGRRLGNHAFLPFVEGEKECTSDEDDDIFNDNEIEVRSRYSNEQAIKILWKLTLAFYREIESFKQVKVTSIIYTLIMSAPGNVGVIMVLNDVLADFKMTTRQRSRYKLWFGILEILKVYAGY